MSPALPEGLSFDASARTITGTPAAAQNASAYTYSATDGTDTAALSFSIRVAAQGAAESANAGQGATPDSKPPDRPKSVVVTRTDGTLHAIWLAVRGATSYHVTYSSDGGASWSLAALNHPGSSITIGGVDNAKTYIVGVRARGDGGDSGWLNSPPAGPFTPPKPPAAPSSVTVTRTDGALAASWTAVEGATSYHVTYSSDGGASWSLAALSHPGSSITISGADNSKTYTVGVRARGDGGDSGWTNSPAAGPYAPPTASLSFGDAGIADQSWTVDAAIDTLTLPAATRSEDGASTTVGATTYSLSPALPAGLSFDAVARTISGTPTGAAASATYTYTAAYGEATAALSFRIEVLSAEEGASAQSGLSWVTSPPTVLEWTQGVAVNVTLPAATGDPSITYSLTKGCGSQGPQLPSGDHLERLHPHPERHAHQLVCNPSGLLPSLRLQQECPRRKHPHQGVGHGGKPRAVRKHQGQRVPVARAALVPLRGLLQRLGNVCPQQRTHRPLRRPGRRHDDLHGG